MKSAEELESWFLRHADYKYWVVYEGTKGRGRRKGYVKANVKDITEAYNDFLDFVETDLSDGEYTVCLRTNDKAVKTEVMEPFIVGEGTTTNSRNSEKRESAGIGNLGSINGLQFIAGLMTQQNPEINRLRDENTRLQLELLEKKFEIKNLEKEVEVAGINTNESWSDIIKGVVKDYFPDMLERFAPERAETAAHVQSLRGKKPVPRQNIDSDSESESSNEAENSESEPKQPQDKQAYAQRLGKVLQQTATEFSTKDPVLVIEIVLEMLQKSPFGATVKTSILSEIKKRSNE